MSAGLSALTSALAYRYRIERELGPLPKEGRAMLLPPATIL